MTDFKGRDLAKTVGAHVTMPRFASVLLAGLALAGLVSLAGCGGGGSSGGGTPTPPSPPPPPPVTTGSAWLGYARNAQHTALGDTASQGAVAAQALGHIIWETTVDLAPPTGATAIHYGSPMITSQNTVLVPVKTTAAGNFRVEAHSASNGALLWSANSDYLVPTHRWFPSFGAVVNSGGRLYMAGSGGKILYRDSVDSATGTVQSLVFYGASNYSAASAALDASVFVNTPITADANGNIFFGFTVTGSNPANLVSGIARIDAKGNGSWIAAKDIVGQAGQVDPAMNAAPAVSVDGKTIYVGLRAASPSPNGTGYLAALDSTTLQPKKAVVLNDPASGQLAWVSDDATSSPLVGPDGDVYYGVLESFNNAGQLSHNDRGWLMHFDSTLAIAKTPGSFGWDDTPSVVPASLVTSYVGTSSYLLLTKYNNYADVGGDGKNRMAILDPNATQADMVLGNTVMKEVMTVLGQTPDTVDHPNSPGAVKEWCINTAAVDPITHSVLFNSEDGILYRWDLTTGSLSQKIWLDSGYGQAYTPTALGPDGKVYSINNGFLFAVGN